MTKPTFDDFKAHIGHSVALEMDLGDITPGRSLIILWCGTCSVGQTLASKRRVK